MHVLTLMFEANGRPSLSEMDGYFETDARGLKDLLDLDGNGQAELLRQSFDDGYWITSLYEARDARWQIIRGRHASREYPLYTRFTNRVNRVPTTPLPGRHPIEDDLSSGVDPNAPAMTLERVEWADVQQSGDPMLRLSNGRECEMAGWYSSAAVIIDAPGGRSTATLGAPAEARKLLEEIARRRLPTRIAGNRRNRSAPTKVDGKVWCSVEMVWAVNSTQLPNSSSRVRAHFRPTAGGSCAPMQWVNACTSASANVPGLAR